MALHQTALENAREAFLARRLYQRRAPVWRKLHAENVAMSFTEDQHIRQRSHIVGLGKVTQLICVHLNKQSYDK